MKIIKKKKNYNNLMWYQKTRHKNLRQSRKNQPREKLRDSKTRKYRYILNLAKIDLHWNWEVKGSRKRVKSCVETVKEEKPKKERKVLKSLDNSSSTVWSKIFWSTLKGITFTYLWNQNLKFCLNFACRLFSDGSFSQLFEDTPGT